MTAESSRYEAEPRPGAYIGSQPTQGRTSPSQVGQSVPELIAIIGLASKFGGDATSPSKLWDLCAAGQDSWSEIPKDRFNIESLYHPDKERVGRSHITGGYFFKEDIKNFDAPFFSLSADVASAMDPQLRMILESVYEGVENAGIPMENLAGSDTSVFSGCFGKDYAEMLLRDPELLPKSFMTGNGTAMLSNRVSHFYDFRGPSLTVDTGCSTGMVALHQAIQSLRAGESKIAITTAACLILNPDLFIGLSGQGVLGAQGRCFAWDDRAEGYGRGEGVATLVVKRLADAIKDGDKIHAVIRESALNQDGKTATITSPSMQAQQDLIERCYKQAGLPLSETGYVEAHMTGTPTGDPIEAEAISRTFGRSRATHDPVIVGGCKTNIGHTEPVSGLAAIIKCIYALKHEMIAPNLNYQRPSSKIPLKEWNLQVPTSLMPWPKNKPLRASVNNFGYGGTNAHVILEAYPVGKHAQAEDRIDHDGQNGIQMGVNGINGVNRLKGINGVHGANGVNGHTVHDVDSDAESRVFIVSSKDSGSTQEMCKRLSSFIQEESLDTAGPEEATSSRACDLAYTLSERRSRLPWITAVKARSLPELAEKLASADRKPVKSNHRKPRVGYVFNGQGGQWHAMGRELIDTYPVFRFAVHTADHILKGYGADWSLVEELMRDESSTRVHDINISQPSTVALQICLVDLLRSWGVEPTAVTSHSSGEIAAAYAVGALSFSEALGVVYYRGLYALKHQKLSASRDGPGGMIAAGLGPDKAKEYIQDVTHGRVVVACINSPESVTLSGDMAALDELIPKLSNEDIFARKLKVPLAYHSHHMEPMSHDYLTSLKTIVPVPGTRSLSGTTTSTIFASPVTGGVLDSTKSLDAQHWVTNLTNPVLFSQAFESMCFDSAPEDKLNVDVIVEIGAHSTLSGPIRQILKDKNLPYVSCLKRGANAVDTMQEVVCELLSCGYPVSLAAVNHIDGSDSVRYLHELPSYAWNHEKQYWTEPRRYKEYRDTRCAPHELLGVPVPGANPKTPTWRNFLRVSEIPWLVDHQLDSKMVLPGAGYIAMAIEAVRVITDASEFSIVGYRLQDVDIRNALVIPDTSAGVEVQLCLRPCSEKELDHKGWYEFEICSGGGGAQDAWIVNCRGMVSVDTSSAPADKSLGAKIPREESFLASDQKIVNIDVESIWADGRAMTLYHGPLFRNLVDCRATATGCKVVTDFRIGDVVSEVDKYIMHPTTLDSIIQTLFAGLSEETKKDAMVVPRSIGSLFIPRELNRLASDKLQAFTEIHKSDRRGALADIAVINGDFGSNDLDSDPSNTTADPVMFEMKRLYCQSVCRDEAAKQDTDDVRMCAKVKWELDVLHKDKFPEALKDSMRINLNEDDADFQNRLVRVAYNYIHNAVVSLEGINMDTLPWHLKTFYKWMHSVVKQGQAGELAKGSARWAKTNRGLKQSLADGIEAENAAGRLTCRVGANLEAIVRQQVVPIDLMLKDNLLNQYYGDISCLRTRSYKQLRSILEMLSVKTPALKVLEIGAGTGGATAIALEAFAARASNKSGTLLGKYDFTDISAGFFSAAKQKFAPWTSFMDFKVLDIGSEPAKQSFVPESYDLIIASQVLHATPNMQKTLSHVRSLLKPNGKLVLAETTQDRLDVQLIFGTLSGWWLSEEPERKDSPNAPLSFWDDTLKESGFTGIDFEIGDCEENEFQSISIIVTTANPTEPSYPESISLVHSGVAPPQQWLDQLSAAIQVETSVCPVVESLADIEPRDDRTYIVLSEMVSPLIDSLDSAHFEQLQRLLVRSQGIFWLSCGGIIEATTDPSYATAQGLLRTLKQEDVKRVVQLDFESSSQPWDDEKVQHITHVLKQSFDQTVPLEDIEWEYAVKGSVLHVPRFYPDTVQDKISSVIEVDAEPERQRFSQSGRPLVWETRKSGLLSNLYFTDKPELTEIPAGKIAIEPRAFGLNFRDVLVGLGQLDERFIGHECAGIVTGLGANTEDSGFKVGDRVCGVMTGRFGNVVHAYWTGVSKIPDATSWEEAASIPLIYSTSWIALFDIARLEKGERVLIHAGTGGVGQSAIMLAQWAGAEVFVTCGTRSKREFLREQYGIPDDHIFSSRDISFAPAIMEATQQAGVDVIVNSLAGPLLKATWECVAEFGRFVEIGKVDLEAARRLDMTPLGRSAMIAGLDLLYYNEHKGKVLHNAIRQCVKLCEEGAVRPVYPITPYSITDMEQAMRQMQRGTHMGKLVIVPGADDLVNVVSRRPSRLQLSDAQATYMVVGGLGGIGKTIAEWLVDHGAKNVVVVSRSAASHPDAQATIVAASEKGCNFVVRSCDVANEDDFNTLLTELSGVTPPVQGVIQAAMVLDDSVLERMTYEQWQHGIRPKVAGSMNLHRNLPDLDFFVMLSSLTGVVGNTSQASYAAGNTFEDGLARYRAANGLPAVSIDLGAVEDVGFVAVSGEEVRNRVEKQLGSTVVPIDRVLRFLEVAIRDPLRKNPEDAQVITCIGQYDRIISSAAVKKDKRFATLQLGNRAESATDGAGAAGAESSRSNSLSDLFSAELSDQEAVSRIVAAMAVKLSELFSLAVSDIDTSMPMSHYGVDSLIAVELRNWLRGAARTRVTIFEILQSVSVVEFARLVAVRAGLVTGGDLTAEEVA